MNALDSYRPSGSPAGLPYQYHDDGQDTDVYPLILDHEMPIIQPVYEHCHLPGDGGPAALLSPIVAPALNQACPDNINSNTLMGQPTIRPLMNFRQGF